MSDAHQLQVKRFRPRHFELNAKLLELVAGEGPRLIEQEVFFAFQLSFAAINDFEWSGAWLVHAFSLASW